MLKKLTQPAPSHSPLQSHRQAAMDAQDSAQARQQAAASDLDEFGSKLIVGPNIKLKGSEITDCDILVVEGRVEVSMHSRVIRIAEGGVFSGKAEIDVAEVHGRFEGELTARKRLVVHATGRISGKIHYGSLQIEEGGVISGNVEALSAVGPAKSALSEVMSEDKAATQTAPSNAADKAATAAPSWLAAAR